MSSRSVLTSTSGGTPVTVTSRLRSSSPHHDPRGKSCAAGRSGPAGPTGFCNARRRHSATSGPCSTNTTWPDRTTQSAPQAA